MKSLTKKRTKAYFIDLAVSTAFTGVIEYFLRKKIKNEAFHALVTPSVIMSSIECVQLVKSGQTIGYKKMGLVLEAEDGSDVTTKQVVKRLVFRDSLSTFKYILNRKSFEKKDGAVLPHDSFAKTIVREV